MKIKRGLEEPCVIIANSSVNCYIEVVLRFFERIIDIELLSLRNHLRAEWLIAS